MLDIKEAGLNEGISEVIVTTRSPSGESNAAPIGIISLEKGYFVRIYKGSKTLSNIEETKMLAANVVDEAILFVKSAFEELNEDFFSFFLHFPVLKYAKSWVLFKSNFIEGSSLKVFQLEPFASRINKREVKAINRGLNAVIEATIHATKSAITEDERKKEEIKEMMAHYEAIVSKCGGKREKEAMRLLKTFL